MIADFESALSEEDILTVITRWQGTFFPANERTGLALLAAILLDPVTEAISNEWKRSITECSTTVEKVQKISSWAFSNLAYTQVHREFSNLPGRDPWGIRDDGGYPTFKKLLPSEMAALRQYTGKISGKCFTLVNLITSCFVQLGVSPDDVVIFAVEQGQARHAMALMKFEGEVLLVNLMLIDFLKNHVGDEAKSYKILGIYNHKCIYNTDFILTKEHLHKFLAPTDTPLMTTILKMFGSEGSRIGWQNEADIPYGDRHELYNRIFKRTGPDSLLDLAKYAYQSLNVKNPECYLKASLKTSGPKELASELTTVHEVFHWINSYVIEGSIFSDSARRIMTADQVLVFRQGGDKDRAVLAYTLLRHNGYMPAIRLTKTCAYIILNDVSYDIRDGKTVTQLNEPVLIEMS